MPHPLFPPFPPYLHHSISLFLLLQFAKREMLVKVFMNHGFQVDVIEYVEVARKLHLDPPPGDHEGIIFIARQFSKPSPAMNQQFEVLFLRILDEPAFI